MYKVWAKQTFSAAHLLQGYDGDCSNIHGHNWTVIVTANTLDSLDRVGISIDMKDLKEDLRVCTKSLDHALLTNSKLKLSINDSYKIVIFDPNPTAEVIGKWIYDSLVNVGYDIHSVEILEGENSGVIYS